MIDDADISKHPVMHVAFDRDHDLGARELSCRLHLNWLTQVEGAVVRRHGMDVVQNSIAVPDHNVLADLNTEYVGDVATARLIKQHGIG